MADNAGKPGDPPTSGDASRQSVRTYDRSLSRPPPARRDPRADPDDEPISERVDVVTMDRGAGGDRNSTIDSLTNAALTLRRELAKLHQQAAAVERTIEDQRRERSDALERADAVNARANELEQRAEAAEAEAANLKKLHDQVRSERDDLARALEQTKVTAEELQRTRDELAALRREKEEVVRAAATFENELTEIRKREQTGAQKATDAETELQAVRERFERTSAELVSAREELAAARAETVKARQDANDAAEVAAQKLSESEHERLAAKEQISRLEQTIAEMRVVQEKVVSLDADLTNARMELVNGRSEIGRLERDIEDVRSARDVAAERATMAEKETADVRKEVERLQLALDAANQNTANASARAVAAERARVASEESVRALRDEITSAFARWRSATPSVVPPPNSVAPATRAVSLAELAQIPGTAPLPREVTSPPVAAEPMKVAPSSAQTAPPSAVAQAVTVSGPPPPPPPPPPSEPFLPVPRNVAPPEPETRPVLDDEWTSPSNPPPRAASVPPPSGSMRSSKAPSQSRLPSVTPPPQSASMRASKPAPAPDPIPPLHPRSVAPPEPKSASLAPPSPGGFASGPPSRSMPPSSNRSVPPPLPPRAQSIPPAVYPSVPPPSGIAPLPAQSTTPTTPPPRPEESSVVTYVSQERANYIELLGSPKTSREAALALREHPDWLRGRPPIELLLALTLLDYDIEEPVFELARAWDRDPLCRALIAALRDEPEPKLREHAAWLLKHLGAAASWPSIAELVSNEEEAPAVRRWLLEAIERLVASRSIGWKEVGDLCQRLVKHGNESIRDGVIGVVAALDRSDDKRRLLLDVLRTDHDEVVLASAVQALTTALPIELDPSVAERLLGHPSARVQQSVVEFIERSKRAAKNA